MGHDAGHAAGADGREPEDHHRSEKPPHCGGAVALEANSATMITAVIGRTDVQLRLDDLEALDAESTEIAGVIMLSPKNRAAPKRPSAASIVAVSATAGNAPPLQHRDECHDAALTVVVGAHDQG